MYSNMKTRKLRRMLKLIIFLLYLILSKFERQKVKIAFVHDFNEVDEKIQELRTPEKIILTQR